MRRTNTALVLAAAFRPCAGGAVDELASSHRETHATRVDPCIDNTDTYAVEPGTHDKLYVVCSTSAPARARPGQPADRGRARTFTRYCRRAARVRSRTSHLPDPVRHQLAPRVIPAARRRSVRRRSRAARPDLGPHADLHRHQGRGTQPQGHRARRRGVAGGTSARRPTRLAYGIPAIDPRRARRSRATTRAIRRAARSAATTRTSPRASSTRSARTARRAASGAGQAADFYHLDEKGIFTSNSRR